MESVPIPVVVAILLDRRRVFLLQRPRGKPLAGEWEFPGGKVDVGEPPVAALRRELMEELGLRVGPLAVFAANSHVYDLPGGPVHYVLLAYRASVRDGPWSRKGSWMDGERLERAHIVEGSRPIVRQLIDERCVR